jgi:oligo-1,6-glucosidase
MTEDFNDNQQMCEQPIPQHQQLEQQAYQSCQSPTPQRPWWTNAVVYQVYPRSFQDSNGDGFGDLKGITQRLAYLKKLGVGVVWLSPVYKSPQDDNGYDISDYQDIDPMFGTLADMDMLLAKAHALGIKVIMDLVVNHTSDEHAWFQASADKSSPEFEKYKDWYWWRPAKEGMTPGEPGEPGELGAEPNHWGSYFGGSAWEYAPKRGEYFLHQFSKKQPDLNWENPAVRQAVYDMMNWWLDRGVDGFRMDVITLISKHFNAQSDLSSEQFEGWIGDDGFSSPAPFSEDGPRLDEFLAEMRREVFAGREGFLTVGEAPGISPERNEHITDPRNGELDMLFIFNHMGIDDGRFGKWTPLPLQLTKLKEALGAQQEAVKNAGWTSLFFDNHDQPRIVSRWGDDSSEEMRVLSAKAIALLLHMHRGTPYIYQGEELGMTNVRFGELGQYRDLESINMYHQLVDEKGLLTADEMMEGLKARSRDNARTPMQWDGTKYAGFTAEYAPTEPWIEVNPNHNDINAEVQVDDPDSVFAFYQKLIALRKENRMVALGAWHLLDRDDEQVYSFTRVLGEDNGGHAGVSGDTDELVVVVNMSSRKAVIPRETRDKLMSGAGIDSAAIVLSDYPAEQSAASILTGKLEPWEAFVYRISKL